MMETSATAPHLVTFEASTRSDSSRRERSTYDVCERKPWTRPFFAFSRRRVRGRTSPRRARRGRATRDDDDDDARDAMRGDGETGTELERTSRVRERARRR